MGDGGRLADALGVDPSLGLQNSLDVFLKQIVDRPNALALAPLSAVDGVGISKAPEMVRLGFEAR